MLGWSSPQYEKRARLLQCNRNTKETLWRDGERSQRHRGLKHRAAGETNERQTTLEPQLEEVVVRAEPHVTMKFDAQQQTVFSLQPVTNSITASRGWNTNRVKRTREARGTMDLIKRPQTNRHTDKPAARLYL